MRVNALVVDLTLLGRGPGSSRAGRRDASRAGIVVCTGRSSVSQRVRGLRMGADDWVTKPCHPEEVLARVEAVVRRRKRASARVDTGPLVAGELEIRADQFQAFVRGSSIDLTRREFEVLQLLAQARQGLQREDLPGGRALRDGPRRTSVECSSAGAPEARAQASPDCGYHHTPRRGLTASNPRAARSAAAGRDRPGRAARGARRQLLAGESLLATRRPPRPRADAALQQPPWSGGHEPAGHRRGTPASSSPVSCLRQRGAAGWGRERRMPPRHQSVADQLPTRRGSVGAVIAGQRLGVELGREPASSSRRRPRASSRTASALRSGWR